MKQNHNCENKYYRYSQIESFAREQLDDIDEKILVHLAECRKCLDEYVNEREKYASNMKELNRLLVIESKIITLSKENRESIGKALWRSNSDMSYEEFIAENERSFKRMLSKVKEGENFGSE